MEKNIVIKILDEVIGTDVIGFISGTVENVGTNTCKLSNERGSVYGFAVRIDNGLDEFKNKLKRKCSINNQNLNNWKPILENWYPLYWGKDKNMGLRLDAHMKEISRTGTLQLCKINILKGYNVVYGALPCINYEYNENKMHKLYPDILKTRTGKPKTTRPSKFFVEQMDTEK